MGCVMSSRYNSELNPHIFDVLNVDDNGHEKNPGQIEVTDTDLILHHLVPGKEPIRWPLNCLRRYGFDAELFSFESGRRCPTGPGIYAFRCRKSELLFNLLQECIFRAGQEERNGVQPDAGVQGGGVNYHRPHLQGTVGGPDHNRLRLLGEPTPELWENGLARRSELSTERRTHLDRSERFGRADASPRLLLSDWAGPEHHNIRLSATPAAPAPNSLASLGQRSSSRATPAQPDYINTDISRIPVGSLPRWSHDYENHVTPFKTGRGMRWITSTLSSQDDLFEDEPHRRTDPEGHSSEVQYADLDLLRHDSGTNGSTEGLPNDEEEEEEDVFPLDVITVYGHVVAVSGTNVTSDETESDTRLVYINVPTSCSSSTSSAPGLASPICSASSAGGRSATLPAISETSDQIFSSVARGHSETSSTSVVEYANIGSPRRSRLGVTVGASLLPNSTATERRSTISCSNTSQQLPPVTMAATAKLQPLSPTNGKYSVVSRLQPLPSTVVPLPLSSLKPPQSPSLANGGPTSPVAASKANQKITYVQLDLQSTPASGSVGSGRLGHPLNMSSGPAGFVVSPGTGSDSPRVLCRASSVVSAAGAAASEGYATIDFQRTLALNSKCADEGVRKTRHNSHIEMVAFN